MPTVISSRERDAAIQALRAGVVPRMGIRHVQVGRVREVEEALRDVNRVAEGGSAARFVIGEYGSGKTFFLTLVRTVAAERKLVVMHADLSPERRLHATGGHARTLCADLVQSMSTRTKPDGGALASVIERFLSDVRKQASTKGIDVGDLIRERLDVVREGVAGFDFAEVVVRYWQGFEEGNEPLKAAALRWLRAEFTLKTEAREALGVRTFIDDAGVYDHIKALSRLVRLAGYDGTLVVLDEMVNLYKLVNSQARNANYEQILRIVNDVLQGSTERLGFYFGGTPEFLLDTRRGLYSYEALRSRLAENSFARNGLVDLSGPVIRLQTLSGAETQILLERLRLLWAGGDTAKLPVPDAAIKAFLDHCSKKVGDAYFRTPRETIRAFLNLLAILEQNPGSDWATQLGSIDIAPDRPGPQLDIDDDLAPPLAPRTRTNDDDGESLASFQL
jgi:bacteriophage exclusion system BrxC/D-like protein